MRIVFLDINGVLVVSEKKTLLDPFIFNPDLMTNLSELIKETDSKIVISSTWRIGPRDEKDIYWQAIKDNLARYDIIDNLLGCTPIIYGEKLEVERGIEIAEWLKTNNQEDSVFIIIDDDNDMGDFTENHLIRTVSTEGFTRQKLKEALDLFEKLGNKKKICR